MGLQLIEQLQACEPLAFIHVKKANDDVYQRITVLFVLLLFLVPEGKVTELVYLVF
jgi:hypothetical protein